jgi:hypothetical protein
VKIPHTPPDLEGLVKEAIDAGSVEAIVAGRPTDAKGRYLHWEELRH